MEDSSSRRPTADTDNSDGPDYAEKSRERPVNVVICGHLSNLSTLRSPLCAATKRPIADEQSAFLARELREQRLVRLGDEAENAGHVRKACSEGGIDAGATDIAVTEGIEHSLRTPADRPCEV